MKREWGEDQWLEEDESMNKCVRELCSQSMHSEKSTLAVDLKKKERKKKPLSNQTSTEDTTEVVKIPP